MTSLNNDRMTHNPAGNQFSRLLNNTTELQLVWSGERFFFTPTLTAYSLYSLNWTCQFISTLDPLRRLMWIEYWCLWLCVSAVSIVWVIKPLEPNIPVCHYLNNTKPCCVNITQQCRQDSVLTSQWNAILETQSGQRSAHRSGANTQKQGSAQPYDGHNSMKQRNHKSTQRENKR